MATHTSSGTSARLRRLLEHHEGAAAAIRLTMTLLNGDATKAKTNGHATVLADALALDTARHQHKSTGARPKRRLANGERKAKLIEIRKQTAAILDALSTSKPIPPAEIAATLGRRIPWGPLVNGGLVKKKGGGYIRTAKPFDPEAFGKK